MLKLPPHTFVEADGIKRGIYFFVFFFGLHRGRARIDWGLIGYFKSKKIAKVLF